MVPDHIAHLVRRNPALLPLRLEFAPPNIQVLWRAVPNIEHGTLCAAFGLDPATFWFDMPDSFRAEGRQRVGNDHGRREISGFVFRGPKGGSPVAKLSVARDGDRFRDRDMTRADFERLGDSL